MKKSLTTLIAPALLATLVSAADAKTAVKTSFNRGVSLGVELPFSIDHSKQTYYDLTLDLGSTSMNVSANRPIFESEALTPYIGLGARVHDLPNAAAGTLFYKLGLEKPIGKTRLFLEYQGSAINLGEPLEFEYGNDVRLGIKFIPKN